jgi:hypothetical protein
VHASGVGAAVTASVKVMLGNERKRFAPGDYVAGVINVRPGRASRWARVRLVLVERSRGHYVTYRTEAGLSIRLVDGTCRPYPFILPIAADAPPTFDTANGSLAWGVLAEVGRFRWKATGGAPFVVANGDPVAQRSNSTGPSATEQTGSSVAVHGASPGGAPGPDVRVSTGKPQVLRIPKRWLWVSLVVGVALWLGGLVLAINFADTRGTLGPVVVGGAVGTVLIVGAVFEALATTSNPKVRRIPRWLWRLLLALIAVMFFAAFAWLGVFYPSGTGVLLLVAAATPLGTATKEGE